MMGEGGVGKTTSSLQFEFSGQSTATAEHFDNHHCEDTFSKVITIRDQEIKVDLFDTVGQVRGWQWWPSHGVLSGW